jgi:spore germination protein GerM
MKKSSFFLLSIALGVGLLSGCSQQISQTDASGKTISSAAAKPSTQQVEKESPTVNQSDTQSSQKAESPAAKQQIRTYYSDDQAMGLKEQTKEIEWKEPTQKYAAAFQLLTHSSDANLIALWEGDSVQKASLSNGLLTIDIKEEHSIGEGSSAERLKVLSVLKTMFQFPEIEKVQILINGKTSETLSGHLEIQHPFTRESLADFSGEGNEP